MGDGDAAGPGEGDLYHALGLTPDASEEDILRAYRRLARAHHPDANPGGRPGEFTALTDAYDVLRDPGRRRSYDATRRSRAAAADAAGGLRIPVHHVTASGGRGAPGAARPAARLPEPGEVVLPLSFDQAALGTTAVVDVELATGCTACDGSGRAPAARCPDCGGAGSTRRARGDLAIRYACERCGGRGEAATGPCSACAGHGWRRATRKVTLRVPAGVEDGARLAAEVPGEAGRSLTAVVQVASHPFFGRRGRDLTLRLPVTLAEAALGAVTTVPTLTGAVAMRVPPGTQHGRTFRVRGRGVPGPDGAGDLLVTVEVVVPTELNDAQRAALEAFAAATDASPRGHLEDPSGGGG